MSARRKEDFINSFFQMEEECRLFDLTYENNPIWDILRAPIYYLYYFPDSNTDSASNLSVKYIFRAFKILIITIYRFVFTGGENIVLTSSRNIDENGFYYDKVSDNIIKQLPGKLILEYQSPLIKYRYSLVSDYSNIIPSFIFLKKNISEEIYKQIEGSLIDSFGESRISRCFVNETYRLFLIKYHTFKFLFRLKKTKRFFYVQNGFQKGYLKAARELNVKTFELQHGSFERDHWGYSYPNFINHDSNILFPDYLLTLGKYWGQHMNIPVSEIFPLGNNEFCSKTDNLLHIEDSENYILIISSLIHADELLPLAKQLSAKYSHKRLYFKLHANEYTNYNKYCDYLLNCENITVIRGEKLIAELFRFSDLVIVIASTVVYEALNVGKKVAIYKKLNYQSQQAIFELLNVYLFDKVSELDLILTEPTSQSSITFFDPFDSQMFAKILSN